MGWKSKKAQSEYQLAVNRSRREKWISENGPCNFCGSSVDLEVDHVDRSTKIKRTDHAVWSWSEGRRTKELLKCQVLCYECHKKKSANEMKRPIPHGTHQGYAGRNCRCSQCVVAHRDYMREYKRKKKALSSGPR